MSDTEIGRARGLGPDVVYRLRTELGESAESLRAMPDAALRKAILKLEHPDRARRRAEHELGDLLDDAGDVDPAQLTTALEQVQRMRRDEQIGVTGGVPRGGPRASTAASVLPPVAGLVPAAGWTEIGPGNIGGRTRAIVIDPTDTDRILAAGVGGGIWRTDDGGASWTPTDDLMGNLAVCSLVMDPTDPDRLWAGTGEGFGNIGAVRGDGIFLSVDGGVTWAQQPATASNPDFHSVNALTVSPAGDVLLAGTASGIFRSSDGGVTWTQTSTTAVGNVVFDPTDGTGAIAGALRGGDALVSVDGGQGWSVAATPAGGDRVQVCYAAADTSVAYGSVDANPSRIWRSTDGGHSYVARDTLSNGIPAAYLGQQGWYDNVIWAGDPTTADLVIVGGIDLWRSTDGGDTLIQISTWWSPDSAHADHHAIVSDPGYDGLSNRRVYFGNDGGIYRAVDVTSVGNNASPPYTNGWANLNNGYAVTQFYYGAAHVGTATIIGGAQDNGTLRHTPATASTWNSVFGGDGGACASDPADPSVWYGEYVNLNVFRNTDGGASSDATAFISGQFWNGVQWAWKAEPFTIPDARDGTAQFIAPFVLDPNDRDRLLGGGLSLWLTADPRTPNTTTSGPSWRSIKASIGGTRADMISAIAVADGDSDVVVVGHGNGNVYRTTDATAVTPTWDRIDDNGIGANRRCLALTIDPDDHDRVYATFGGYQNGNVWTTDDAGQTWTDLSGGLPAAPVRALALHPQRTSWLYVATEVGVFASEDGGASWSPTNEGPADVSCHDLFWLGATLVVATHGRGIFQIDLTIANAFPAPQVVLAGSEDVEVRGTEFTRYRLDVTNAEAYPDSLFRPSPDLPPCGLNDRSSRTWVDIHDAASDQRIYGFCALDSADDLHGIWFAVPRDTPSPREVYVVLRDRRCNQSYASDPVAIPTPPPGPEPRRITHVERAGGAIVGVAGPWGAATVEEVIAAIEGGDASYHIEQGGARADVTVVRARGRRPYLRSTGDRAAGNNLESLPDLT